MKKSIIIIIVISIVAAIFYNWHITSESATKEDLEKAKRELKMQIDSILRNCDTLKNEIRTVKANTDTLRAGQEAIFNTMQENKEKSLLDYIFK